MLTNLKKWVQNAAILLPDELLQQSVNGDTSSLTSSSTRAKRLNEKRLTIGGGENTDQLVVVESNKFSTTSSSTHNNSSNIRASSFSTTLDLISSKISKSSAVINNSNQQQQHHQIGDNNISTRSSFSFNVEDSASSSSSSSTSDSSSTSTEMDNEHQQQQQQQQTSSQNRKLSEIHVVPPPASSTSSQAGGESTLSVRANRSLSSVSFTRSSQPQLTTYHNNHRHSSTLSPTSLTVNHHQHHRKVSLQIPPTVDNNNNNTRLSHHQTTIYKRTLEQYNCSKRKSCSSLSKSEIDCSFCFICNSSILTYCSTSSLNNNSSSQSLQGGGSGGRSICSHCSRCVCNECSIVSLINDTHKKYGLLCKPCSKKQEEEESTDAEENSTTSCRVDNEIINLLDEEETSEAVSDKQLLLVNINNNNNSTNNNRVISSSAVHASIVPENDHDDSVGGSENRRVIRSLLQHLSSSTTPTNNYNNTNRTNHHQRRQSLDEQAMKSRMARESGATVTTINSNRNTRNSFAINNNNNNNNIEHDRNNINGMIEIYTTSYDVNDQSSLPSSRVSFYPNNSRSQTPKTKRRLPTTPSESQLAGANSSLTGSPTPTITTTTTSALASPHSSSRSTPPTAGGVFIHDPTSFVHDSVLSSSSTHPNANEIFIKLNEQLENLNENIKNQTSPPLRFVSSSTTTTTTSSSSAAAVVNDDDDIERSNKLEHHRSHEHVAEWLNSNSLLASPPPSQQHQQHQQQHRHHQAPPLHKQRQNSEYSTSSTSASDFLSIPDSNMSKQNRSNSVSTVRVIPDEPLIEINLSRQFYIKRNSQMSLEHNNSATSVNRVVGAEAPYQDHVDHHQVNNHHHKLLNKTKSQSRILSHHHLKKDDTRTSLPLNEITDDTCDKENEELFDSVETTTSPSLECEESRQLTEFVHEELASHTDRIETSAGDTIQRILVYKNPKELSLESGADDDDAQETSDWSIGGAPRGFNRTRRRPSNGLGLEISARQKLPDLDPERHGLAAVVASVQPDGLMGQYGVDIKQGDEILEINGVPLRNKNDDQIESIIDSSAQSNQGEMELVVRRSSLTNLSTTSSSCSSSIVTTSTNSSTVNAAAGKNLNQIEENGELGSSFENNDKMPINNINSNNANKNSGGGGGGRSTLRRMHEIDSRVLSGEGRGFREISIKRKNHNHSGFNGNSKRDTLFSDPALLFAELKHYKNMMNKPTTTTGSGGPSLPHKKEYQEPNNDNNSTNDREDEDNVPYNVFGGQHRFDLHKQFSDVGHTSSPSSPNGHFFQNSLDEQSSRYEVVEAKTKTINSPSINSKQQPPPTQSLTSVASNASRKSINLSNYRSTSPFKTADSVTRTTTTTTTDGRTKPPLKSTDSSGTLLGIPRTAASVQRRNSSSNESGYDSINNTTRTTTNSSLRVNGGDGDDLRRKLSVGSTLMVQQQVASMMTSSRSVNNHSPSSLLSKEETLDLSSSTYSFTSQSDQTAQQQQTTRGVSFLNVVTDSAPKMVKEDSMINMDNSVSPFGDLMLQLVHKEEDQQLIVKVVKARNLIAKDANGFSDPFVKVYLLPGRDQENKRRTKYVSKNLNPEWHSTLTYAHVYKEELKNKTLEFTLWDWDRFKSNDFLGMVKIELNDCKYLDDKPRWFKLRNNFYTQDENGNISPSNKSGSVVPESTTTNGNSSGGGDSLLSSKLTHGRPSFRKSLRRNKDKQ